MISNTFAAFLVLLLVASSIEGRANRQQKECNANCDGNEDNLFKMGKVYTYLHRGESRMQTTNGSYDSTGVLVKSKVTIVAVSKCQMRLSMSDVEIFDKLTSAGNKFQKSPYADTAKEILERNTVFFTRNENDVTSMCVHQNEPIWSQNMKKSIIDMIANTGDDKKPVEQRETRHGSCLVEKFTSDDKTRTLTYDMRTCNSGAARTLFTDLTEAVIFDMSRVQCKYAYQQPQNPQSILCSEEYITTPLKQKGSQIQVLVTTRLEKTDSKEVELSYPTKYLIKTVIQMQIEPGRSTERDSLETKAVLITLCKEQLSVKRVNIPRMFMTLVNQMKKLSSTQMKDLYVKFLKETDNCGYKNEALRIMFYDAIGFVNTPAATAVMVDLIKNKHISEIDQNVWFTSLSFIKTIPTIEMIKDLESLLQTDVNNRQMYLGISSVVSQYCRDNYESCLMDPTIRNILSFYLNKLGNDCTNGNNNELLSSVQISLKSLGNLKLFNEDVVAMLGKCVSSKSNPTAIRVSALEVMKHMDCTRDRSAAMKILEDNENDSEIRINAYLTVMGCPDINTMFKVRELLSKEKVNQVGSFIWTHLTNIRESNDVLKRDIQTLLTDVELKKEFDISKLKFSRNIEKTFSTDRFGVTLDSNVIFSEKSFIPRSISLNTTAMVLGRPTNFIEVSTRMEGLDEMLFKLLGPDGYLKKKDSANAADDNMKLIKMLEEVNGNFNLKVFGQQISFVELIRGSLSSVRKYNIIEELLKLGEGQSIDFTKNLVILDSVASLPTSLGFPLKLKVQGSLSVELKVKTKLDITGLMKWPININVESHIAPSVMGELTSEMIIETPFHDYGLSTRMTSGSNTEFKAIISASNNEDFLIKFDTPKEKQEIFTVSGKSFVIYKSREIEQFASKKEKFELCSPEKMTRMLGVKMCAEAEITKMDERKTAILYGPFSANVYIEKVDSQTGYVVKGLFKTVPFISDSGLVYNSKFLKLELDTPKSKLYSRRFAMEMTLDFKENVVKFELDTPWKQALLKSTFKFLEDEKHISLIGEIDKRRFIETKLEHLTQLTQTRRAEKGLLSLKLMDLKPFETRWLFVGKKDQWMVKFESKGFFKDDTYIKMDVKEVKNTRELALSNKYKLSGSYETYFGKGHISGVANSNYYGHRWDITVKHTSRTNPKNVYMVKYSHKTEDKSSKSLHKYFLTSTISYGENAENFVKFKVENELSKRHIRASIKTTYGIIESDLKSSGEMDLQLYGGFAWKGDKVLSQEGSLSFKFPAKRIHYEGRYNSEIGNRMFKMSFVLDENQTSKVNMKVNYQQPKMYLKDTEIDVQFSVSGLKTELNWALIEMDVNKYKYSLTGKYNNYVMKIDGVQTEISRLKYDSSIKISMPAVKNWPEKMNIDLRVDFVNPISSRLNGKIEIPNTDHKYSVDLKMSTMPDNFLQMPISDKSSVFRYTIEVANKYRTMKSETIFTCNPEEVQLYLNFAWNTLTSKDQQVTFDFHTFHKSPNHKQYDNAALIALHYPGNSHSIGFKSKFKYSELEAQIDVVWNKNRKILILATYEVENNWTEMGLKAAVTMKTPFVGFETTHLGINAIGQLRYRKVDIEFSWAGNKKILFDIVVQPRSSNDFTLTSKLVTPFKGFTLVTLQALHICTKNSIKSEAAFELGASYRYNLKFEGINNSEGKKRDFGSNIQIETAFFPPVKVSVSHKDDGVHFTSKLDLSWMKSESINVRNEFSYTFEDRELITNGNMELLSSIDVIKQMKATWSMENRDNTFMNNVQLFYKSKNLFQNSIKGFFEKDEGSFKMDFNGFMRILDKEPMKVTNFMDYDKRGKLVNNFSIVKDTLPVYSHALSFKPKEVTMKMLIVNTDFKTVEYKSLIDGDDNVETRQQWLKIGEKHVIKQLVRKTILGLVDGKNVVHVFHEFFSDFWRTVTYTTEANTFDSPGYKRINWEVKSKSISVTKGDIEVSKTDATQKVKVYLESKWKHLTVLEFQLENQPTTNVPYLNKVTLNYNNILKIKSKIIVNKPKLDVDILFHYQKFVRYFKFKYDRPLMGYDQLLETNLFGTTFKVATTIEARGGMALHTSLICNLPFLKSIDVIGRFSKRDHRLDILYKFPTSSDDELIKLTYSKLGHVYLASIETKALISTTIKMNLNEFRKVYFDFRTLKTASESTIDVKFDYEGGINSLKHYNDIKINFGNTKFVLENKFEKVKWSYVRLESRLMTNIPRISNYKVGLEYKQRPSTFEIDLKMFCNERFVTLSTKLLLTSDWTTTIKLETSYPILREIIFDIRHKQNKQMTQVSHGCEISLKSNDRKFQIKNKVDWSEWNFISIESSVVARTSQNSYIIKPRSFKLVHQLLRNTIKEVLVIQAPDLLDFKANLELQMTEKLLVSIDLQLDKRFKLTCLYDVRNNRKNIVKLYLEKDSKRLINVEGQLEGIERTIVMRMKIEETGSHSAKVVYDMTNLPTEQLKVLLKSSLLPDSIDAVLTYDYPKKEITFEINGVGKKKFLLSGKFTTKSLVTEVKYGKRSGSVDVIFDDKETKIKAQLRAWIRAELDFKLTSDSVDAKFILNDHLVRLQGLLDQFVELDVKVVNKIVYMKIKSISKAPYKYEISGRSNFRDWSTFNGEIYVANGPENYELTSRFSREDNDIYNIIVRQTMGTFHFKYGTILDVAKSGTLAVNYGKKFSLTLAAETIKQKIVKISLEKENSIIRGKVSTTFEWMKEMVINGELKNEKDLTEGSFLIEHNKLKEPLRGKISYKVGLKELEVTMETSLSKPMDKFIFTKRSDDGKTSVELRDRDNVIFLASVTIGETRKKEVTLDLNIPKQLIDLQLTINAEFDFRNTPYTMSGTVKSNLLQETRLKLELDPPKRSYSVTLDNPSKQGSVTMKVSETKTSVVVEYNGERTSIDLIHELTSTYVFNGKMKVFSNMYPKSPLNFEMSCSHSIALPQSLSVKLKTKWNDKTALSFATDWRMSNEINFDLKSSLLLAPYENEYTSALGISNKNGEEFSLEFTPLGKSKSGTVTMKIFNKMNEVTVNLNTPYGLLKSLMVKAEFNSETMKQKIALDSTLLGQLELINEYKPTANSEGVLTSQLKTQYKYGGEVRMKITYRNKPTDKIISVKLEVDKDVYQGVIERNLQRMEIRINSPISILKNAVLTIKKDVSSYKVSLTYNEYQGDVDVQYSNDDLKVLIKSTTPYTNTISFAVSRSVTDDKQRIFKFNAGKDDKTMTITITSKDGEWKWTWGNTLCPFLANKLDGRFTYSRAPINVAVEISKESEIVFKIKVSEKELLVNAKTSLSEMKIQLTKSRLELIVMNSRLFSLLIRKISDDQVDVAVTINETKYLTVARFVNDPDSLYLRIKVHKDDAEKLVDFYFDVSKLERSMDTELNVLTKQVFKLKLSDKTTRNRKISTEIRVLFFTGIFDFDYLVLQDVVDGKIFWNVKLDDNQLCLGSITTTLKHSPFKQVSVNLNFASGAYQLLLDHPENSKIDFKLNTPYKQLNLEFSVLTKYDSESNNFVGDMELRNEILGEYKIATKAVLTKNFELMINFDTTRQIVKTNVIIRTTTPNLVTVMSKVKFYDWDPVELLMKLETLDNIKVTFDLRTPFQLLKKVSFEKILWMKSAVEHKFKTVMEYKGIISVKYVGGHEISYLKRIIKFNGNLETDELKFVSLKFHGSKTKDEFDHLFIVDIKERRFGYKIKGKFDPMFRGTSEIYSPFHSDGVFVLQGHQRKNGIKIQAGKDKEEIAAFEMSSSEDVTFMKVTPPTMFGKPLAMKYRVRRGKRSASEEYQSEIKYGGEKLLNFNSKVNFNTKKKMAMFKVSSPMLSGKSAELKLLHQNNDGVTRFDHHLKIKDIVENMYRIAGEYFFKDSRNFKYSVDMHHPYTGPVHFSMGHNIKDQEHFSNILLKTKDRILFLHNGKLVLEGKKINGEFEIKVPSRHYQFKYSHLGDQDRIQQRLATLYNTEPYFSYQADIVPQQKSVVEIDLPVFGTRKLKLIFDRKENKAGVSLMIDSDEYLLDLVNDAGKFKAVLQMNSEMLASLQVGYATTPLSFHVTYRKQYLKVQVMLKDSLIVVKADSSHTGFRNGHLRLTKNKIILEATSNEKPIMLSFEYHFVPNNFFAAIETSWERLTKVNVFVTSTEIKINLNEYFHIVQYNLKDDNVMIDIKNNIFPVKTLKLQATIDKLKKTATTQIRVNEFVGNAHLNYSDNHVKLDFDNNLSRPKRISMEVSRKTGPELRLWLAHLTVDKVELMKMMAEVAKTKYSAGLKTSFGTNVVVSFDTERNELILSLGQSGKVINVIGRTQRMRTEESKTCVISISVDTVLTAIHKSALQVSYTATKSDILASAIASFNNHKVDVKGQLTKSKFSTKVAINERKYSVEISLSSTNQLNSVFSTPYDKVRITLKKLDNKYSMEVSYNDREVLRGELTQNMDVTKSFDHLSTIRYRGIDVWNVAVKSNFKVTEMKMSKPNSFVVILKHDLNENDRTLSVWTKYNGKEKGLGVTIGTSSATRYLEISVENTKHLMKVSRKIYPQSQLEFSATLFNKVSKNQWKVDIKTRRTEVFEIGWSTPTSKRAIKFHQITKDGFRSLLDIDIVGQFKMLLKASKETKGLSGELTVFGTKIARMECTVDKMKAVINENGPEDKRIHLEWIQTTKGVWKKDYVSTRRLIVKQKGLNIDVDVEQELKMESSLWSFTTTSKYLMMDGMVETMDLIARVDFRVTGVLTLELMNPILPMKMVLRRQQPDKSTLRYDMESTFNVDDKITGFMEVSVGTQMGVTSRIYYNPENEKDYAEVHAKYLDDRQMEIRMFSETERQNSDYFLFLVRLLNEHNLETTFHYRAVSIGQVGSTLRSTLGLLLNSGRKYIQHRSSPLQKEYLSRFKQGDAISPTFTIILGKIREMLRDIDRETRSFVEEVTEIMGNNEFYLTTIVDFIHWNILLTVNVYRDVYYRVIMFIESIDIGRIFSVIGRFNRRMTSIAWNWAKKITDPLREVIITMLDRYFPRLCASVIDNVKTLVRIVRDIHSSIWDKMRTLRKVNKFIVLVEAHNVVTVLKRFIVNTFGALTTGSLDFLYQEKDLKVLYDSSVSRLESMSKDLTERLYKVVSGIDDKVYMLTGERYCVKIRELLSNITEYVVSQLKDETNQRIVKGFLITSIEDSFIKVNTKIQSLITKIIIPRFVIVNQLGLVDDVKYTMTVTLPIPLNDIRSIPDFTYVQKRIEEVKDIVRFVKKLLRERVLSGQKFIQLLRWFTPRLSINFAPSLVPDFESYATILGTSVVTFDKKALKLRTNSCRVLLAKDMRSKKWEIELEQTKTGRIYSLRVGKDRLSISVEDGKVTLNGKPTELPLSIGTTKIVSFGNIVKVKDELLGLTVVADPVNDMFTVGVSGWYHGKVRGLFGTADNEPFNDMLDDAGKMLTSENFFKSYNNGGQACQIAAETKLKTEDNKNCPFLRKVACKFLYQCPFSPMASCFGKVNPMRFYQSCISSSEELSMQLDNAVCQSVRDYQSECAVAGITITVPLPCRKCDVKGEKPIFVNEERNVKIKLKVADIVFVVDEGKCLKTIRNQLVNIITKIDENLKEKGITSNRYGLVAFRGDGINDAHSHTVNQKLFGSKEEMLTTIKSLQSTNQNFADVIGAIKLATKYPYREYASKHIVLINCNQCEESASRFKTVTEILENNAIQFSVLMAYNFQVKDGDSKKMIFGVDLKKIYTTVAWRGEMVTEINRPVYDYCYDLAMRRNGVVFNINYLLHKGEATQRRFIDTFTTQVCLTAAPARTTVCKCFDDGEYNCVPVDTYAIFPIKKST